MMNRTITSSRFFSRKNLFSPPRLIAFLCLLLWGLVPNQAYALSTSDVVLDSSISFEWNADRGAFYLKIPAYTTSNIGIVPTYQTYTTAKIVLDGTTIATINNAYEESLFTNFVMYGTRYVTVNTDAVNNASVMDATSSYVISKNETFESSSTSVSLWINPYYYSKARELTLEWTVIEGKTSSTFSSVSQTISLYNDYLDWNDYSVAHDMTVQTDGTLYNKFTVSGLGDFEYTNARVLPFYNKYGAGSYYSMSDYAKYVTASSNSMNCTIPLEDFGLTDQEFANGLYIGYSTSVYPDSRVPASIYVSKYLYKSYHTGASQVFDNKNLTVEQNGSDLNLSWKVVNPELGTDVTEQDMNDYQIERYVNGAWEFVANVATNTSLSAYSYTYAIPDSERLQGTVNYLFRVWKKRFASADVLSDYMCSNTVTTAVNTNYRSITISSYSPNSSSQMAALNWTTGTSGMWGSEVDIVAEVVDVTNGGMTEFTASYSATSMNLTNLFGCSTYSVTLYAKVDGVVVSSSQTETILMPDDGEREITNLVASKGYYNTYVRLTWEVPTDASDFTHFNIVRKNVSTGVSTNVDQITHSGLISYNYQDYGMDAGVLYEYSVEGYSTCQGVATIGASQTDMGFSQPYAKASGRIAYSGSQAVSGVAVSATTSDASANSSRSLYFDGNDENSNVTLPDTLFDFTASNAYSIQFWINPLAQSESASSVYLFSKDSTFDMKLYPSETGDINSLCFYLLGSYSYNIATLPLNTWSHVTGMATLSSDNTTADVQVYINGVSVFRDTVTISADNIEEHEASAFMMGSSSMGKDGFKGYIDELRIFNAELDSATIAQNFDIFLAGTEDNLLAYYRCDEEGSDELFDLSATGSVFHMLDGAIGAMVSHSAEIPSAELLAIKTYTDVDGNYLLTTIPYTSAGLQYNIVPTLGIHEFSPNKQPIYTSPESVVFNSIDFEDISSFPVSGVVYYEGTLVPVEGAELYIDGVICSVDGEIIYTDDEGKFSISVPIGDHHISVKLNGHTFVDEGRYPTDANNVGTKYTFDQEVTGLTFYDNTLVNIAGRVAGGEIEEAKALGLLQSKNNIGSATLVLSHGSYNLNAIESVSGTTVSYIENPENVTLASATTNINSSAYKAGGNNEDVKYIYITTDPATGEFSAMVPPLAYTIEDVSVGSNVAITFSNLSAIDASNPLVEYTDSVTYDDGTVESFVYNTSTILTYRSDPSFSVVDASNEYGAFGSSSMEYSDLSATEEVSLYTVTDGVVSYPFGAPVFIKGYSYDFDLYGYEEYLNYDEDINNPVSDKVPLQYAVVTITNEMSDGQSVYIEEGTTTDGEDVQAGDFVDLASNQLELDSLGMATYTWTAGYPNITDPYTRGISMVYEVNGENVAWDGNTTFEGIVFGDLPSGNNFVTSGPDEVLMILRDPAGSNSFSFWEAGQTVTKETTNSGSASVGGEMAATVSAGTGQNIIAGTPATGTITEVELTFDIEAGISVNSSIGGSGTTTTTTTTTKTISTSDNEDYVGAHGDVFVGMATNIIFGNARNVGLTRDAYTGEYSISLEDVITTGSTFGTAFNYTEYYIEEVLIPNLYLNRDALLETVTDVTAITNTESTDLIYVTTLTSDDERFGSKNTDTDVWGSSAVSVASYMTGPSYTALLPTGSNYDPSQAYQDMVLWYNTQIEMWEMTMAANEEAKVKVIDNRDTYLSENLSFDQGVSIESSVSSCDSEASTVEWSIETGVYISTETGLTVNNTGVSATTKVTVGAVYSGSTTDETETCSTTGFTLADDGLNDALSIDVFNAPDGYGAIFVTRGGQTSCPFEDATYTKYYEPGTEISAATMQVEIPVIESDIYYATDVPAGGTASYVLSLRNDSETGDDVWFDLKVVDATNANGASLSVDGSKLTESGRTMLVPAGGTLTKTLQLTQTETDVLEYENIAVVLVSQCQYDPTGIFPVIADTIYLSAQFVPTCSDITLTIAETTMNMFTSDTLTVQMTDFDRTYNTFESIRLQYKYANDADWTLAKEYVLDEEDVTNLTELLPTGGIVSVQFPMSNSALYPDGTYQFRLQTTCSYGTDGVYTESDIVTVTKDMAAPQILGTPNPSDGILSSGDDISITFNEDIRSGSLTDAENFIVTGILNGATIAHEVALRLDGADYAAATTEANIPLANTSFAIDFWLNYTGAGTLIEHGSATNKFIVAVNDAGNLVVTIGETVITSSETIPTDSWCFVTMNYDNEGVAPYFTALVASDASSIYHFTAVAVPSYTGVGTLAIGEGVTGAMHEVALWNTARSTTTAQSEMYTSKAASTLNLIGYWELNEGYGTQASDVARSRHMTLANETWYLNNENIAAQLSGDSYLLLDISTVSASTTDSHMLEMWFRGDAGQTDATLFSVVSKLAVQVNANGNLVLLQDDVETILSTTNYLDDNWHHFAINSLSNGFTTVYVDGVTVKQIATSLVETIQGSNIVVGAFSTANTTGEGGYIYSSYFTGAVDEIRYWVSTLNADYIKNNRYNRVSIDDVAGLKAYYPFEIAGLDSGNQVVYLFDLEDHSENAVGEAIVVNVTEASNAPALQSAPELTNLQFSYVASEREIVITLLEEAYRIEGTTVNFTVKNVRDDNNNLMDAATWSAYINQNCLVWGDSEFAVEQLDGSAVTISTSISNSGASYENWTISGMPTWMSASVSSGTLNPLSQQAITLTIDADMAIGNYEEVLYLSGNDGIYVSLPIALSVKAEAPDWSVNPADFENSMVIMGTLSIMNVYSYDSEDIVAAFIGETCVGVQSPVYNSRYDTYFVLMSVYGNSEHAGEEVTFKVWDASTGLIHPVVTTSSDVTFSSNAIIGSLTDPFTWNAEEYMEQSIAVTSGWNWVSLSVDPKDTSISSVFETIFDNASEAKYMTSFAIANETVWYGSMTDITSGLMYRVNMNAEDEIVVTGSSIDADESPITVFQDGWSWIGYTPLFNLTVNDAFADLNPQTGDLVKSISGFATYQDYEWIGNITAMESGVGYMYYSVDSEEKEFTYPSTSTATSTTNLLMAKAASTRATTSSFSPVRIGKYSGNMTMVATVQMEDVILSGADVGVFADDECRTSQVSPDNGYLFLTIPGDEAVDLTFQVVYNGSTVEVDQSLQFRDDDHYGTLAAPYVIQLASPTGIGTTTMDAVRIYPNPAQADVYVESDLTFVSMKVCSVSGAVLYETTSPAGYLDFSGYSAGIYFVILVDEDGNTHTERVIKQ